MKAIIYFLGTTKKSEQEGYEETDRTVIECESFYVDPEIGRVEFFNSDLLLMGSFPTDKVGFKIFK